MKSLFMFLPSVNKGGNEKNFFSLANNLSKHKLKINIISCDPNKVNERIKFKNQLKLINFEKYKLFTKYIICFFLVIIKNRKKDPILSFQGNLVAIFASMIIGCDVFVRFNSYPDNFLKNNFKIFIFKFFYKRAKKIFVNSKEMRIAVEKNLGLKCKLIYNEIDIKKIRYLSKKKIKYPFFKNKNLKKFIIVGRLDFNKNHFFLINTICKVKDSIKLNLLILGSGPERNKLSTLVNKCKLNEHIKFLEYKKNPYPYINKSDYLILSSFFEGYPNVLIEAGILNKLIISSDCKSGPKEIIQNNRNGYLFKNNNEKSLIKALYKSINNKKNSKKIKNLENYILKNHLADQSNNFLNLIFKK